MYSMIRLGRLAGEILVALLRVVLALVHQVSGGMLRWGTSPAPGGGTIVGAAWGQGVERGGKSMDSRAGREMPLGRDRHRVVDARGGETGERDGPGRSESFLKTAGAGAAAMEVVGHVLRTEAGEATGRRGGNRAARQSEKQKESKAMRMILVFVTVWLALTTAVLAGGILGFERGGATGAVLWGGLLGVTGGILGAACLYLGMRVMVRPAPRGGSSGSAPSGKATAMGGSTEQERGRVVELVRDGRTGR